MWADNETEFDLLGFDYLVDGLVVALTEPRLLPVTIGVLGDWGSGKSSLMLIAAAELAAERRADAGEHSADDDDDKHQTRNRISADLQGLFSGYAGSSLVASADRHEDGDCHNAQTPEESRYVSGQEQRGDGYAACDCRENDERVARRDQDPGGCGRDVDCRRIILIVAFFLFHRSHDSADSSRSSRT